MDENLKEKIALALIRGRKMMNRHLELSQEDADTDADPFTLVVAEYACACFYEQTIKNALKASIMMGGSKADIAGAMPVREEKALEDLFVMISEVCKVSAFAEAKRVGARMLDENENEKKD
jgi:hypothetical protein